MAYRELDVTFGKIIKDKRQILGITQEKIAELIGISTMHFRNIESGKTCTNWVTWVKICAVLGVDITCVAETYIKPEINEAGEFLGIKV